jgi:hypothetical protein
MVTPVWLCCWHVSNAMPITCFPQVLLLPMHATGVCKNKMHIANYSKDRSMAFP